MQTIFTLSLPIRKSPWFILYGRETYTKFAAWEIFRCISIRFPKHKKILSAQKGFFNEVQDIGNTL